MTIIVFEGIDFSGKTTQAKLLQKNLLNYNINAPIYNEPGGTPISEKIRNILLEADAPIDTTTQLMLFLASRSDLTQNVLKKANPDNIIILDRYIDSTVIYQGIAKNNDANFIHTLCNYVTESIMPDITFYISINIDIFTSRAYHTNRKLDTMDKEAILNADSIINAYNLWYNTLVKDNVRNNIYIMDGTLPVDTLHEQIMTIIQDKYVTRR